MTIKNCKFCGINFMQHSTIIEIIDKQLCNTCLYREEIKNSKKKEIMSETINMIITIPKKMHAEIEEFCMNKGISFSEYFLELDHIYLKVNPLSENIKSKKNKK